MADETEQQLENAIKSVENITEIGGYLKKETKEELQKAVRTIRSYIKSMKSKLDTKKNENENYRNKEDTRDKLIQVPDPDSCPAGQVAPSLGHLQEATNRDCHTATSDGETENHQDTILHATTRTTPQAQANEHNDRGASQTAINNKLETIIDFLENKLDQKIEQKINQRLINKTPMKLNYPEKRTNNMRDEENTNTFEENNRNYQKETERKTRYTEDSRPYITGQRHRKEDDELEAAEKMAWLYIGGLKRNTTESNIRKFLERNGIEGNIECEELRTLGDRKAFKLGFPYIYLEDAQNPDFWPQGIKARRFRFRRYSWRREEDDGAELQ